MVVEKIIKHLTLVVIGLTLFFSQQLAALTLVSASVDKNPVTIKESLVLTVIADDDVKANALDTSALLKNFIVGRTSVSTQTSMINFKTSRTTRWSTVLIAKKTGKLTIPALTIENKLTQPIEINVLAASDKKAITQQDIFITNVISSNNIYVQQLLTLSVKLHFSAELKRGNLSKPTLNGANILQIGKDQESEQLINGKRFRVIERIYAINPQESGEFKILSPRFSGEIMMQSARRTNFLSFAETKPVSIAGNDIALTVRPIPVTYQGQWLPSEILTLHQEWLPDVSNFKVGEPITRTITLTAAGLSKEQLPKLTVEVPKGLKVYPDQAELHSSLAKDRLVSQQIQSFAIVASRAGSYDLPVISIPWFNIVTNQIELAQLPAQKIIVHANADFPEEPAIIESNSTIKPLSVEKVTKLTKMNPSIVQNYWLQWLFLSLWLLTSFAWVISFFLKRKTNNLPLATKYQRTRSDTNITDAYRVLISACKSNQAEKVLSCIIPWVNGLSDNSQSVTHLNEAIKCINNKDLTIEINLLQQSLYGKKPMIAQSNWQGGSLLLLIKSINKQGLTINNQSELNINP